MAKGDGFWSPTGVDQVRMFLYGGIPLDDAALTHAGAFRSNIAYNVQYLQFLNHQLTEEDLHVTVRTLTFKTFVITGMGIVEAVLWYVLKKRGAQRRREWEEMTKVQTSPFKTDETTYKIENVILKRVAARDEEMNLDSMIKKVESKKLLGVDNQVYKDLNYLRKLRNRVHIHSVQHDKDTDWWNFNDKEVDLMKGVLNSIFRSSVFKAQKEHEEVLSFLKVAKSTDALASEIPDIPF